MSYSMKHQEKEFSTIQLDRIIEIAWEDRNPFEAKQFQFGLNEAVVKVLMKQQLKFGSYILWRKRVEKLSGQTY